MTEEVSQSGGFSGVLCSCGKGTAYPDIKEGLIAAVQKHGGKRGKQAISPDAIALTQLECATCGAPLLIALVEKE